jgi:hypothetical protein
MGKERVVAYESRKLSATQRNYPAPDLEFLAVMEMLRKWRHYIHNNHETKVYTDVAAIEHIEAKPTWDDRRSGPRN